MRLIGSTLRIAPLCMLFNTNAYAHHPLDGMAMTTMWHGLLSGFAHPVLGIDHLLFAMTMALGAMLKRTRLWVLGIACTGVVTGVLVTLLGFTLSGIELVITASLLLMPVLVLLQRLSLTRWLFILAGLFSIYHGAAYADVLVQQSELPTYVITGFMIALPISYALIFALTHLFNVVVTAHTGKADVLAKLIAAVSFGFGLTLLTA